VRCNNPPGSNKSLIRWLDAIAPITCTGAGRPLALTLITPSSRRGIAPRKMRANLTANATIRVCELTVGRSLPTFHDSFAANTGNSSWGVGAPPFCSWGVSVLLLLATIVRLLPLCTFPGEKGLNCDSGAQPTPSGSSHLRDRRHGVGRGCRTALRLGSGALSRPRMVPNPVLTGSRRIL
jgi:hypothetical protein